MLARTGGEWPISLPRYLHPSCPFLHPVHLIRFFKLASQVSIPRPPSAAAALPTRPPPTSRPTAPSAPQSTPSNPPPNVGTAAPRGGAHARQPLSGRSSVVAGSRSAASGLPRLVHQLADRGEFLPSSEATMSTPIGRRRSRSMTSSPNALLEEYKRQWTCKVNNSPTHNHVETFFSRCALMPRWQSSSSPAATSASASPAPPPSGATSWQTG